MNDEVARWRFRAKVHTAMQGHAKGLAGLLEMLDADHPLTPEDKHELANYIRWLTTPGKAGKPVRLFSEPWVVADAASTARALCEYAKKHHPETRITKTKAAKVVCESRLYWWLKARNQQRVDDDGRHEALLEFTARVEDKMARSRKPEPKRTRRRR